MIQSRTLLPFNFTYLPYKYYVSSLGICSEVTKFETLIKLNNSFYSILNSSNPEEAASKFVFEFNNALSDLTPDIITKYSRIYGALPPAIGGAGLASNNDETTTTPAPGTGSGGSGSRCQPLSAGGSDQMSMLSRRDFIDSRDWKDPEEKSPGLREYLENVQTPEEEFQAELDREAEEIAKNELGSETEYQWNKTSPAGKKNISTLSLQKEAVATRSDPDSYDIGRMIAEAEIEESQNETLSWESHNIVGSVERSRRLATATEQEKESIKNNTVNNRGKICSNVDEFHFRFNPYDPSQRLLDIPAPLVVDSNKDTHGGDAKTFRSRTGKAVPTAPDKNHDLYMVAAQKREEEEKFSEVDRGEGESNEGPIAGDVGTESNKNNKEGGISDKKSI